ncbi:MAG: YraN family protein [Syntrophomonadaceae bacterium]|jgi:putative endonuclease|nr:YraN family protein [Syntrophomonadaceae bacterium]
MKKITGRNGENSAVQYLKQKGYQIIARNYRTRLGEIDIICDMGPVLVFVEVKTRTNLHFGYPEEAINQKKKETIKNVASLYLQEAKTHYEEIRFDVIGIFIENGAETITHTAAAF